MGWKRGKKRKTYRTKMIITLRRVRGRIVRRIRLKIREKKVRRRTRIAMGVMRVTVIRMYMTIKRWIHCGRVGMYGGFRGERGGKYR